MVGKFTVRINGQEVKSPTLRFAFLVLLPLILLSVFLAVLIILIGPIGIIVGPVVLVALYFGVQLYPADVRPSWIYKVVLRRKSVLD
jgi:hypothetical protein